MPDGLRADAAARLAALDIHPSPEFIEETRGPTTLIPPSPPKPPRVRAKTMTLDTIRQKLVTRSYRLLHEPAIWDRLRQHLLNDEAKVSLKAFEILFAALVTSTKSEAAPAVPLEVNILNHIPGPVLPSPE